MDVENDQEQQLDENDQQGSPVPRGYVRDLEKKAKRVDSLEAKLKDWETKDSLRESGISLNEKQYKALLGAHDGELNPEALKATAEELGFYKPEPKVPSEEEQAHGRVNEAFSGSSSDKPDLSAEDEYSTANTADEVMAMVKKRGYPTTEDGF